MNLNKFQSIFDVNGHRYENVQLLYNILPNCIFLLLNSPSKAFNDIVISWIDILPADLRNATSKKLVLFDRLVSIMRKYLQRHPTSLKWCDSLATAIRDVVGKDFVANLFQCDVFF